MLTTHRRRLTLDRGFFIAGACFVLLVPIGIGLLFREASNVAWLAALCGGFVTLVSRLDALAELSLGTGLDC